MFTFIYLFPLGIYGSGQIPNEVYKQRYATGV